MHGYIAWEDNKRTKKQTNNNISNKLTSYNIQNNNKSQTKTKRKQEWNFIMTTMIKEGVVISAHRHNTIIVRHFINTIILLLILISINLLFVDGGKTNNDPSYYVANSIANQVFTLDGNNFHIAINNPNNPLWLLKFYAPWYVRPLHTIFILVCRCCCCLLLLLG